MAETRSLWEDVCRTIRCLASPSQVHRRQDLRAILPLTNNQPKAIWRQLRGELFTGRPLAGGPRRAAYLAGG
jgi:hypothetical protein